MIWNLANLFFSGAAQLVAFRRARQHVWDSAAKFFPNAQQARKQRAPICFAQLDEAADDANYFERDAGGMRYPAFRAQGLFVGSRLKQSGKFWSVCGANAIIALRCCRLGRGFEDDG